MLRDLPYLFLHSLTDVLEAALDERLNKVSQSLLGLLRNVLLMNITVYGVRE